MPIHQQLTNLFKHPEFSSRTLVIAVLITLCLTAANAYIGLMVGMTVSASIPAAALSMAILSWFKNSNIQQSNMVQTSASAGEALAAGVIFITPALVITNAWEQYHYWQCFLIALSGGLLGTIFTIPLRNTFIVQQSLPYPEGVATAKILQSGFNNQVKTGFASVGTRHIMQATGIGAVYKLTADGFGMMAQKLTVLIPWSQNNLLFHASFQLSPALLAIGYILGIGIAAQVFIGGLVTTLLGIPLQLVFNHSEWLTNSPQLADWSVNELQQLAAQIWQQNRSIGVGTILVGAIYTFIKLVKPLFYSIKQSVISFKLQHNSGLSEQQDLPNIWMLMCIPLCLIAPSLIIALQFNNIVDAILIGLLSFVLLFAFAFVFSSVAGYMAGVVGSSNNPVSAVTICTVLLSAILLYYLSLWFEPWAKVAPIAVLFIAAVVCCSAAIAGDTLQDLKCGHEVNSAPWKQQCFQILGVVLAATILPLILSLLDTAYGIGRSVQHGITPLAAPQAGLMAELTRTIFDQTINLFYLGLGVVFGIIILLFDALLHLRKAKFKLHILAIAIGMYLPFALVATLFAGGLISAILSFKQRNSEDEHKSTGILIASGLVTGEALMGVMLAISATFIMPLPTEISAAQYTGLFGFALVALYLYKRARSKPF
ncbi:OPT family oligopeptide transporter [Catenovulum agarivorans DS-2]|uniref:OPT family oligopeptide transporter n=1 Tax=Catenovulum agarivorans DS-2 TaxID=1328313 RepID=W7QDJ0_9ALTE|nr:oligopeptide transporter, OPT family [Catenovulum agarivorans]EWH09981.1 OPT family oligopeptide transporter [Catenovulum agarivorans DS-2]